MNAKVTTFVYSIAPNASKTTLDFENVVVKFGNPKETIVTRSSPRRGGTPAEDNTYTWLGWGEGKWSGAPVKSTPRSQIPSGWLTNGPAWTNGTPVSGKDCVVVDAGEGVPWEQAGGVVFNLYWSMDFLTIWGPPEGKYEKQLKPSETTSKGLEVVVVRLVKRTGP